MACESTMRSLGQTGVCVTLNARLGSEFVVVQQATHTRRMDGPHFNHEITLISAWSASANGIAEAQLVGAGGIEFDALETGDLPPGDAEIDV